MCPAPRLQLSVRYAPVVTLQYGANLDPNEVSKSLCDKYIFFLFCSVGNVIDILFCSTNMSF